jgi:hypothetical protein
MEFTFIKLDSSYLQRVEAFFKSVYQEATAYGSTQLFEWKIFNNIHHEGLLNAAVSEGEIASTTTLTPKTLYHKQKKYIAAEIGDTYTQEKFQRRGLFGSLVQKTREEGISLGIEYIYGTPNANSLPGYVKKCNFAVIPELDVHSYSFLLDVKEMVPVKALTWIINFFYRIFLSCYLVFKNDSKVKLTRVEKFGPEFDALWAEGKGDYDYIFSREAASLNWRFNKNPYDYQIFCIHASTKLIGYIVIRENSADASVAIADYFCLKNYAGSMSVALAGLAKIYKKTNYKKLVAWVSGKDYLEQSFRNTLFIKRNNVPIIAFNNDFLKQVSLGESFHFTLSDSDNV